MLDDGTVQSVYVGAEVSPGTVACSPLRFGGAGYFSRRAWAGTGAFALPNGYRRRSARLYRTLAERHPPN